MGTSRSDPSPNSPPWRVAKAALGRADVPPDRQVQELWRAAIAERVALVESELGHPLVSRACDLAAAGLRPDDAVARYDEGLSEAHEAGFTFDLARRALARVAAAGGARDDFAAELFSEATSYLASRDLSSLIGAPGRVQTVSEAIQLKDQLRCVARECAREAGRAPSAADKWPTYVRSVLDRITTRRGRHG